MIAYVFTRYQYLYCHSGELDALIAAVARSRQDIVVTNNIRHFVNISNLKLENWLNDS